LRRTRGARGWALLLDNSGVSNTEGTAGLPARLGQTALGVARAHAAESRRLDRFFNDPLAEASVEAAGSTFATGSDSAAEAASGQAVDVRPVLDARANRPGPTAPQALARTHRHLREESASGQPSNSVSPVAPCQLGRPRGLQCGQAFQVREAWWRRQVRESARVSEPRASYAAAYSHRPAAPPGLVGDHSKLQEPSHMLAKSGRASPPAMNCQRIQDGPVLAGMWYARAHGSDGRLATIRWHLSEIG
jgi:hypothetical protein